MTREQDIPKGVLTAFAEIKEKRGILSEIMLPDILVNGVPYSQVIRVKDTQISLSIGYIKVLPQRVKIHKDTGEETTINTELPDWTIREDSESSWMDPVTGEVAYFPTRYRDEEGVIIPQNIDGEMVDEVMETVKVNTIQYLEYLIDTSVSFKAIMQMFTKQYVISATENGYDFTNI